MVDLVTYCALGLVMVMGLVLCAALVHALNTADRAITASRYLGLAIADAVDERDDAKESAAHWAARAQQWQSRASELAAQIRLGAAVPGNGGSERNGLIQEFVVPARDAYRAGPDDTTEIRPHVRRLAEGEFDGT